ncbi:hypothetical protein ACFC0S_08780 [Streptomyces sp. NPDC056084]|uniref:hypothetical protein n=1 Tax=unclassified Streptomyces TaxID=2593676 RepID=UPI0035DECDB6
MADESKRPVAATVVVDKGRLLLVRRRIEEAQLNCRPDDSPSGVPPGEAGLQVAKRF